ncbi:hypothetical protein HDU76_001237 [Blyttiomyces sp. JEL0837]|nr:hypothetical protein HDU76_001237 [Blyttiomyces sp. JEL0837]
MVIKGSPQSSAILTSAITTITILTLFTLFNQSTRFASTDLRQQQHPRPAYGGASNSYENSGAISNTGSSSSSSSSSSGASGDIQKYLKALRHLSFIHHINDHERKIYSQWNEDGIIEYIFDNIGVTDKYYVEFGVETCSECTTRHLWDYYGWDGLLMDGDGKTGDSRVIQNHFFTRENIVELFQLHKVPKVYDFMMVDVDQNEYPIAKAILDGGYRPNVLALEINRNFGPKDSYAAVYDAKKMWKNGIYFGQSPLAATRLAKSHGYIPVYYDHEGVNMFFIHVDKLQSYLLEKTGEIYTKDEIELMTPTFEMVYRRQKGIHVTDDNLKLFYQDFPKFDWEIIGEDGNISGRLKATA